MATTAGLFQWRRPAADGRATTRCKTALTDAGLPARGDPGRDRVRRRHRRRRALRARCTDGAVASRRARRWTSTRSRSPPIRDGGQVRTIVSAAPSRAAAARAGSNDHAHGLRTGLDGPRPDPVPLDAFAGRRRWCCARRPTAGSTSTARATNRPAAATSRGPRQTRACSSSTRTAPAWRSAASPAPVTDPRASDPVAGLRERAPARSRRLPPRPPRPASEPAETGADAAARSGSRSAGIRPAWTAARAAAGRA